MSAENQKYYKINAEKRNKSKAKRGKVLNLTLSETTRNMTQPKISNINDTVLTIEGVLEDIMSQNGAHLWEKQVLEIVNLYDDKNNRARIRAYRKAIVMLQDRLHKRDNPYMGKS